MPNLHDSVTYCRACDHYVAAIETQTCAECPNVICPDCAKPTKDPDVNVCSYFCAHQANKRMRGPEAA